MRCFHRAHYQPENMTVVTRIAQSLPLELVSRTFQQFSERCDCCPPQARGGNQCWLERRQELYLLALYKQTRLLMALTGPEWIRSAGYGRFAFGAIRRRTSTDVTGRTAIGPGD